MSDGLEGVVAAQTVLSHSDGERGLVWVRGHPIGEWMPMQVVRAGEPQEIRVARVSDLP